MYAIRSYYVRMEGLESDDERMVTFVEETETSFAGLVVEGMDLTPSTPDLSQEPAVADLESYNFV